MEAKSLYPTNHYDNRVVAFIDILGFSNIIKSTTKNNKLADHNLSKIINALDFIHSHFNQVKADCVNSSLQLTQFSDSIVISVLNNTKELIVMCKNIKFVQVQLLCDYKVLLRGGIIKGELKHTDDLLLGPAVINAYTLESKCALNPRIVIDPKVKWLYDKVNKQIGQRKMDNEKVYKKDFDGTYYIDYFNHELEFYAGDEEKYFRSICELISQNVNSEDISVRMKYLWMREKLKKSLNFKRFEYIYKEIVTNKKA